MYSQRFPNTKNPRLVKLATRYLVSFSPFIDISMTSQKILTTSYVQEKPNAAKFTLEVVLQELRLNYT